MYLIVFDAILKMSTEHMMSALKVNRLHLLFESFSLMTSWPLVGNEGMNPQYTNVKVDSLIPY